MTFSSPTSFYDVCSSTKCYSIALSSSNSSMNTESINVAPGPVSSFAHQLLCFCTKINYKCSNPIYIVNNHLHKLHLFICTFFLLHIPKMMMNAMMTLQPTTKYSTNLHDLLFSIPLLLLFFSTNSLPPPTFICAHSFTFPFPLLLSIIFQLYSLHSCCYEVHNFKNAHNFQQQTQTIFITFIFLPTCHLLINP